MRGPEGSTSWRTVALALAVLAFVIAFVVTQGAGPVVVIGVVALTIGLVARTPAGRGTTKVSFGYTLPMPPERAFAYLDDPDLARRMSRGGGDTEVVDSRRLADGRLTTTLQVRRGLGPTRSAVMEQVEREPNRRLATAMRVGSTVLSTTTSTLEPSGDGTRVESVTEALFAYPLIATVVPSLRKRAEDRAREAWKRGYERSQRLIAEDLRTIDGEALGSSASRADGPSPSSAAGQ